MICRLDFTFLYPGVLNETNTLKEYFSKLNRDDALNLCAEINFYLFLYQKNDHFLIPRVDRQVHLTGKTIIEKMFSNRKILRIIESVNGYIDSEKSCALYFMSSDKYLEINCTPAIVKNFDNDVFELWISLNEKIRKLSIPKWLKKEIATLYNKNYKGADRTFCQMRFDSGIMKFIVSKGHNLDQRKIDTFCIFYERQIINAIFYVLRYCPQNGGLKNNGKEQFKFKKYFTDGLLLVSGLINKSDGELKITADIFKDSEDALPFLKDSLEPSYPPDLKSNIHYLYPQCNRGYSIFVEYFNDEYKQKFLERYGVSLENFYLTFFSIIKQILDNSKYFFDYRLFYENINLPKKVQELIAKFMISPDELINELNLEENQKTERMRKILRNKPMLLSGNNVLFYSIDFLIDFITYGPLFLLSAYNLRLMSDLDGAEPSKKWILYVSVEGGAISYSILKENNEAITAKIEKKDFENKIKIPTSNDLWQFQSIETAILKVTSERKHTISAFAHYGTCFEKYVTEIHLKRLCPGKKWHFSKKLDPSQRTNDALETDAYIEIDNGILLIEIKSGFMSDEKEFKDALEEKYSKAIQQLSKRSNFLKEENDHECKEIYPILITRDSFLDHAEFLLNKNFSSKISLSMSNNIIVHNLTVITVEILEIFRSDLDLKKVIIDYFDHVEYHNDIKMHTFSDYVSKSEYAKKLWISGDIVQKMNRLFENALSF